MPSLRRVSRAEFGPGVHAELLSSLEQCLSAGGSTKRSDPTRGADPAITPSGVEQFAAAGRAVAKAPALVPVG